MTGQVLWATAHAMIYFRHFVKYRLSCIHLENTYNGYVLCKPLPKLRRFWRVYTLCLAKSRHWGCIHCLELLWKVFRRMHYSKKTLQPENSQRKTLKLAVPTRVLGSMKRVWKVCTDQRAEIQSSKNTIRSELYRKTVLKPHCVARTTWSAIYFWKCSLSGSSVCEVFCVSVPCEPVAH